MTAGESRIKLWIITYHLNTGGVEEVILTYAKLLDKKKYSLTVICLERGVVSNEIAGIAGVELRHITTGSRIKRFIQLWLLARTHKPDIIHNHACWYGLVIGFLVGARRIETVHNTYHWFRWHEKIRYSLYLGLADKIIAVAEEIKKFTIRFFLFVNEKKFEVIYNGVEEKKHVAVADPAEVRLELQIPPGAFVVGFVGRLTDQKGLRYLLEAAARLRIPFSDSIYFVILGDGELKNDLRSLAKSMELSNIVFTGFQREVRKYLSAFDVLALPSLFEGLPVTLLEAMAAGLPVIATRVGGVPEVLEDGVTGFIVEPRDAHQLADKIKEMFENPEMRASMSSAAKDKFVKKFSADTMIRRTEALYSELVTSR
jgi:glycosyltransferase involved in cell wall biosynthesis